MIQTEIDFVSRQQNSYENQKILEAKKPVLNNQCRVILHNLKSGQRLTVAKGIAGIWDYKNNKLIFIGDMRARIRDLISKGVEIEKTTLNGNYKEYWIQ